MKIKERELTFKLKLSSNQMRLLKYYIASLEPEMMVLGLKFAYNRQIAKQEGYLLVGRKSKIKKETRMLTQSQAIWRLDNWKSMIKVYRSKGYSYPTICRIKKVIRTVAKNSARN
jgi:hypothetical protein